MSVVNQFGKLFNRKPAAQDAGTADDGQDLLATGALDGSPLRDSYQAEAMNSVQGDPDGYIQDQELPSSSTEEDLISLPLLGRSTAAGHQRRLLALLAVGVVVLALIAGWVLQQADRSAQQLAATGQSLMQSQRLAKSVSQALVGSPQAFPDVVESSGVLARNVRALSAGDSELGVQSLGEQFKSDLDAVNPLMERAERNASVVMGQQKILTQVGDALRTINRQSSDLLEIAETVSSLKLQQNAQAAEISAAGQLVMLTQRIGKSANEFQTMEGVSPEAVFLLGKDLNSFKEIAQGLLDGSPELRLTATKDAQTREQLEALIKLYEQTRTQASAILGNLQGLVSAREAQSAIIADSEPLRRQLEGLQTKLSAQTGLGAGQFAALALAGLFVLLCGIGISRVQLLDSRGRQAAAETQQKDAKRQEQEAKRRSGLPSSRPWAISLKEFKSLPNRNTASGLTPSVVWNSLADLPIRCVSITNWPAAEISEAGAFCCNFRDEMVSAISSRSEDWRLMVRSASPTWVRIFCCPITTAALRSARSTSGAITSSSG